MFRSSDYYWHSGRGSVHGRGDVHIKVPGDAGNTLPETTGDPSSTDGNGSAPEPHTCGAPDLSRGPRGLVLLHDPSVTTLLQTEELSYPTCSTPLTAVDEGRSK